MVADGKVRDGDAASSSYENNASCVALCCAECIAECVLELLIYRDEHELDLPPLEPMGKATRLGTCDPSTVRTFDYPLIDRSGVGIAERCDSRIDAIVVGQIASRFG